MHLAVRILFVILVAGALLIPRLQWRRAAFAGFVALGLGSFPIRAGWPTRPLSPSPCELLVDRALALYSFRNTPHIVLFHGRRRSSPSATTWAAARKSMSS